VPWSEKRLTDPVIVPAARTAPASTLRGMARGVSTCTARGGAPVIARATSVALSARAESARACLSNCAVMRGRGFTTPVSGPSPGRKRASVPSESTTTE
jgi:hypothetical protein